MLRSVIKSLFANTAAVVVCVDPLSKAFLVAEKPAIAGDHTNKQTFVAVAEIAVHSIQFVF